MIVTRKRMWLAFAVGAFLSMALLGFMALIIIQGGARNIFERHFLAKIRLTDASGIVPGAQIKMLGLRIGGVHAVDLAPDNTVTVTLRIEETYRHRIRIEPSLYPDGVDRPPRILKPDETVPGSVVSVQNPGLIGLGDLTLIITPAGDPSKVILDGMFLPARPYVDPADALIRKVGEIAKKAESEGSLGDLLADGGKLYRSLSSSVEEAERLLKTANTGNNSLNRFLTDQGKLFSELESATGDLKTVASDVQNQKLAGKIDELIRKIAELADSLKATADKIGKASDDVPTLAGDARHTFDAAADAAEAVKRHWLIYSYVSPVKPPEQLRIDERRSRYK